MTYKKWLESFGPDKEIHLLEEKNGVLMVLTRDKPGDPYPRNPMYHVWKGDEWIVCTSSSNQAYAKFAETVRREEEHD